MDGIYAHEFGFLGQVVQLGVAQNRVIAVDFPATAPPDARSDHEYLDRIGAYFEGTRDDFENVTVALTMKTAHARVLETVRELPYGEDVSVEELTRMVPGRDADDEDDRRVAREALAGNPVPIFVPDHRVRDGPSGAPPDVEQKLRALEGL